MELNGIATAKVILRQIQEGKLPATNKWLDKVISALEEQERYLKGNNPDKFYGYPKTYNKS
jgi:hypothetical protein